MKNFIQNDFLLSNETAKKLYHNYASKLPIIDYHCHIDPADIAGDKKYSNITEIWLGGDHYKWRAMRSCGVDEKYITGGASDYEKFRAFARIMPKLAGNPMYHWSHMELKKYFGYTGTLSDSTCDTVWNLANEKLRTMSVRGIIDLSSVETICTTDDPADKLEYHKAIAKDGSVSVKVYPAFRPDKGLKITDKDYPDYIRKLASSARMEIKDFESLKSAYIMRMNNFDVLGCRTADHGIDTAVRYKLSKNAAAIDGIFKKALAGNGGELTEDEIAVFRTAMYLFFASQYKKRGWVMQIHFGVLRNPNSVSFRKRGPDSGYDIIGAPTGTNDLALLLDRMNFEKSLPKMILYSINPADDAVVAAMCGAFQDEPSGGLPSTVQGAAWWFNDNEAGIRRQLEAFANLSALGSFLGMLTDSRSFLSYTRHEYFRRIFCDMLGSWVETGRYPSDITQLKNLVCDVCYNNTNKFFGF
ncbi:MAG: glucuronate isomerase [Clostridia bacterium]|nr:glucuronate isomerase [Clostridia bacterium]